MPAATQLPSQITFGATQTQSVGLFGERGSEIARAHGRADIRDVAREGAIIWEVAVRRRIRNEMR